MKDRERAGPTRTALNFESHDGALGFEFAHETMAGLHGRRVYRHSLAAAPENRRAASGQRQGSAFYRLHSAWFRDDVASGRPSEPPAQAESPMDVVYLSGRLCHDR